MSKTLTLYTGAHCHLCDQAKALIEPLLNQAAEWQLEIVSITGNDELQAKYGVRIPVVAAPNGEEKGWPFTQGQVKRLMDV